MSKRALTMHTFSSSTHTDIFPAFYAILLTAVGSNKSGAP